MSITSAASWLDFYDPLGNLTSHSTPQPASVTHAYDSANRLTQSHSNRSARHRSERLNHARLLTLALRDFRHFFPKVFQDCRRRIPLRGLVQEW